MSHLFVFEYTNQIKFLSMLSNHVCSSLCPPLANCEDSEPKPILQGEGQTYIRDKN
jgi:hypothetical protein